MRRFLNTALWLMLGHFYEPPALVRDCQQLIPFAVLLGNGGADRDRQCIRMLCPETGKIGWFARFADAISFSRKLLFVLVAVHGPLLLTDLAHGMATGFAFAESLSIALSHGVYLLLTFSLPVLASCHDDVHIRGGHWRAVRHSFCLCGLPSSPN